MKNIAFIFLSLFIVAACHKKTDSSAPATNVPSGNCKLTQVTTRNYKNLITYDAQGRVEKFIAANDTFSYTYGVTGQVERIFYQHNNKGVYLFYYDNQGHVSDVVNYSLHGNDSLKVEEYTVSYSGGYQVASINYNSVYAPENNFSGQITFDERQNPVRANYTTGSVNIFEYQYDNKPNVTPFIQIQKFPFKLFVPANNLVREFDNTHQDGKKDSLLTTSSYTYTYSSDYITTSQLKYVSQYSDSANAIEAFTLDANYSYNCK